MHQRVKRFEMRGEIGDDSSFIRLREQFESMVIDQMKEEEFVPILGFGPFWSTKYVKGRGVYKFVLSVHGVKVEKGLACQLLGVTTEGKKIPITKKPSGKSSPSAG